MCVYVREYIYIYIYAFVCVYHELIIIVCSLYYGGEAVCFIINYEYAPHCYSNTERMRKRGRERERERGKGEGGKL